MPGMYLSYPFCSQKCTFCNFASGVFPLALEQQYQQAVLAELNGIQWPWTPETLYLGGGTPSSMEPAALAAVLQQVPGAPWREATIEAANGTLTPQRVQAWRELGINRVSMGVQSFVQAELARTGRTHTAETVQADVALLREHGMASLNIDLIAGLPGQTPATWRQSLDWIARLAPDHVSVYVFEVDEDSRLGKELLQGGLRYGAREVPTDDTMAELYEAAVERLQAMGLPRYEVSNFARPGCESLHNLKYWTQQPYLGVGADAHSFDGQYRWQNAETALAYVQRWQQGKSFAVEKTEAHPAQERFFIGLRLQQGIVPTPEEWRLWRSAITRHQQTGLLDTDGTRLWLTDRGVLLSNEVLQDFVEETTSV